MTYGLALSGGALRGAAHIGILEVLHEENLIPEILAGTSAGSIVGSLYASGMTPKEIDDIFRKLSMKADRFKNALVQPLMAGSVNVKSISGLPLPKGLLNADFIEKFLRKYIGRITFENLARPLAVTAADLHTGELVVFTAEKLIPPKPWPRRTVFFPRVQVAAAVRASSSIPGIFTPKVIGTRTLLDGGLVDNVPADILHVLGAKTIIAVDLGFGVCEEEPLTNVLDILLQTHDISGQRIADLVTGRYAHLVLRPQTAGAGLLDFHKIPAFIEKGRQAAQANLAAIKNLVNPEGSLGDSR